MNIRRRRVCKRRALTSGINRLNVFSSLSYPILCTKRQNKNESIMSIELVIGRDHGEGVFRASINMNAKFGEISVFST